MSTSAPIVPDRLSVADGVATSGTRRFVAFVWKYVLGAFFCTSLVLSVVVVGWTHRAMTRVVLRYWWRRSPARRRGLSFEAFLQDSDELEAHRYWPNWIVSHARQGNADASWSIRRRLGALVSSLFTNAKLGVRVLFNTWVLTLPACALWLFAWFAGWNNSFHKGYELAFVGPLTGFAGVALFVAAMLYVPYAQVRHAVSAEPRRFFDVGLLRRLRRSNPLGAVALALVYSAVSVPLNVLFILPAFFPQMSPELAALEGAEAHAFLETYYFWVAFVGFGAFVGVRLLAARVYAATVLNALAAGVTTLEELSVRERGVLARLGLSAAADPTEERFLVELVGRMGARLSRTVALAATLALWFSFVAQIFVREFFHYHPVIGWLNQTLVHLPYFSLIPPQLGG